MRESDGMKRTVRGNGRRMDQWMDVPWIDLVRYDVDEYSVDEESREESVDMKEWVVRRW